MITTIVSAIGGPISSVVSGWLGGRTFQNALHQWASCVNHRAYHREIATMFLLATNLLQLCFMLATNLFVPDHLRISQKIVTKRVDLESDSIREKKKIFGVWTKK